MGRGGSASQQQQHLQALDPDRPRFHVHPPQGWMNDPNGPVYYKGRYHMFYQHLPNACEWAFGIVWGHAVSSDLVHWEHLPPALAPTPGTLDADGCFSGSCVLDSDGTPVLLYTGVRLRSNEAAGPLPPPEHDLGMVWVESQMAAVPEDPDDDLLIRWRKVESPFLHLPPSDLQLTGWRDPFIFTTNTAAAPANTDGGFCANGYSQEIRMLIGSGLKGQGGTALVYKSCSLLDGWELEGTLCEASNTDTGVVWECPLLVPLDPVPRTLRAPNKTLPPRWLVSHAPAPAISVADSGGTEVAFGSADLLAPDSARVAEGTSAAVGASPKLQLSREAAQAGSAAAAAAAAAAGGADAPAVPAAAAGGADAPAVPAASDGSSSSSTAQAPSVPSLNGRHAAAGEQAAAADGRAEEAEEAAEVAAEVVAEEEKGQPAGGFAFKPHSRSNSFEFGKDSSYHDLSNAEDGAASAALAAWQLHATSTGGSAIGSPGSSTAALLPPPAVPLGSAAAEALRRTGALVAVAFSDVPSNAAALPPGPGLRGRRPIPGAKLSLENAATLEDWSNPISTAASPALPQSSAGSPEKTVPRSASAPAAPRLLLPPAARPPQQLAAAASRQQLTTDQYLEQQRLQQLEEDRFAAAFSQIRGIRARKRSQERYRAAAGGGEQAPINNSQEMAAAAATAAAAARAAAEAEMEAGTPLAPPNQWHFFTVSPDAPTNPVIYWMGHVEDAEMPRFLLDTAKGPYRLDLGDVLYAPNVCQDGQGRWLLWGWLQERRKMGSYNYAGCLTLPRELHCTEDGRLIQAPIPELAQLRQGDSWRQHTVHVPSEEAVPLQAPPGVPALDIELTLDRGTGFAAGLLFRSYEAEAEGGTALIYDWDRNTLEAIFNVPPNWQPQAVPQSARHSSYAGGEQEPFDPALLLTPRPGMLGMGTMSRGMSPSQSLVFSPEGVGAAGYYDSASGSPQTARTESVGGEMSGSMLSPQRSGISIAGVNRAPQLDLGIPGLAPPPQYEAELAGSAGFSDLSGLAAFSRSLPRSLSALPAGFLTGRGPGGGLGPGATPRFETGSMPVGTGGLYRSVSDGRAMLGGMTRVGSYGSSLPRMGSETPRLAVGMLSPRRSPQPPMPLGADTDADLDFLLDELAAPMREAPPPVVEPRRVGGPLPLMHANQAIHLRIIVDHSCIEVYTGTGEVLSTRIYRGQAPEGTADAGISFISFGGTALVKQCSTWEMGSAWDPAELPAKLAAATSPAATSARAGSPKQPSPVSAPAAAAAAAGGSHAAPPPAGVEAAPVSPSAARAAAAAAADALLDEMVTCIPPSTAVLLAAAP